MAFRTKKISQMDPKGAPLASTDLLEISELVSGSYVTKSITGAEIVASIPPTSVEWGDIGGVLSTQTDLQNALNGKVDTNATITGATKTKVTYDSKGLVTSGTDATTADIADSLNKRYVTDANLTTIGNQSGVNTGDQTLSGLGGVPTSRTLTINGTTQDLSANRTFTISTGITIGTTAITSGTVGRVLFEGTGNVVSESANLFWDNTNRRLGVGTSAPAGNIDINASFATTGYPLIVKNTGFFNAFFQGTSANNQASFYLENDRGSTLSYGGFAIGGSTSTLGNIFGLTRADRLFMFADGTNVAGYAIGTLQNVPLQFGTNNVIRATVFGTGNWGINTTTDAGFKLDVNGTARVQGKLTVSTGGIDLTGTLTNFSGYQGYGQMQLFSASAFQMFNSSNNSKSSFQYTNATGLSLSINPENLSGVLKGITISSSTVASANNQTLIALDVVPTFNNGAFTGVINLSLRTTGKVRHENLPTSPTGLASGDLWNDAGTLKIV